MTEKKKENIFKKAMGRPLKYQTPADMIPLIEEYFANAVEGEFTITGLCLSMGCTRQRLCEYEERPEFRDTVKRAKLLVEQDYEKSLRQNGRAGEIFGLKNFGWKDKYDVENSGNVTHEHTGLSAFDGWLEEWGAKPKEKQPSMVKPDGPVLPN